MKKLIIAAATSALMAGTAFAQNAIVFDDGVQKNATITDYDMAPSTALVAPEVEYEGYERFPVAEYNTLTADKLDDANVYGINGEEIGEIDELILSANGQVERVVLEVGGFLGIGEREVVVPFDRMTILRRTGVADDFRIYMDSTQERLEALPEYEATYID